MPEISAVFVAGKVAGNQYTNDYFSLTLTTPDAEFTIGGFISSQGKRACLIDAEANARKWEDKRSVAILADALSANPLIHSPAQYLRSARHQFEKQGLVTVQEESPVHDLRFAVDALDHEDHGRRPATLPGDDTTFLKGHIVSLQGEAPSLEKAKRDRFENGDFQEPTEVNPWTGPTLVRPAVYNRGEFPTSAIEGNTPATEARERGSGQECPLHSTQGCRWKRRRLPCFARSALERRHSPITRFPARFPFQIST